MGIKMVAFLRPASGGIQPINGTKGGIINESAAANQGKPGGDIILNPINQILGIEIPSSFPVNNCDPQSQLQRVQQQLQRRVQQIIQQQIIENIKQGVAANPTIQNLQQQLQEAQQNQNQATQQQVEILEKEIQSQLQSVVAVAIGLAAAQLPTATKLANTTSAGLTPIAAVAESLSTFVPSQGINMSNYGSTIKTVHTVSQACSI